MSQALVVAGGGLAVDAGAWLQEHVSIMSSNTSWLTVVLLLWKLLDIMQMTVAACRRVATMQAAPEAAALEVQGCVQGRPTVLFKTPSGHRLHVFQECGSIRHVARSNLIATDVCRSCLRQLQLQQTEEKKDT